jgi:hypothetical protein
VLSCGLWIVFLTHWFTGYSCYNFPSSLVWHLLAASTTTATSIATAPCWTW